MLRCERCKNEVYRQLECNYCNRKICENCMKSSQRISKTNRLVICKDCWSNMKRRKRYKNKSEVAEAKGSAQ